MGGAKFYGRRNFDAIMRCRAHAAGTWASRRCETAAQVAVRFAAGQRRDRERCLDVPRASAHMAPRGASEVSKDVGGHFGSARRARRRAARRA
eukprot:2800576-Pyramimonas_sp.AAC.1